MPLPKELDIAIAAVRQASLACRAVQTRLAGAVLHKEDRSPVTVADFASQALICRALAQAFPADAVVAEEDAGALRQAANAAVCDQVVRHVAAQESDANAAAVCQWIDHGGAAPAPRFWTLDPIDGTLGFLRGEQYAIALALLVDGEVVLAALGCPNLSLPAAGAGASGAIFAAVKGQGATVTPLDGGAPRPIRASQVREPARARYCESVEKAHTSQSRAARVAALLGATAEPVRMDSQAKYAVVASGDAEAYMRFTKGGYVEKIWDHAAGYLICTEAGGRASDTAGQPLDFSCGRLLERNQGVVVTNGPLHEDFLRAIARTGE